MFILTLNKLHITPSCLANVRANKGSLGFILIREVKITEEGDIVYKNERDDILPTKATIHDSYRQSILPFFNNVVSKLRANLPNCSPETLEACQETVVDFDEMILSGIAARNNFIRSNTITIHMSAVKSVLIDKLCRDAKFDNREQAIRAFDDIVRNYQGHQVWVNF